MRAGRLPFAAVFWGAAGLAAFAATLAGADEARAELTICNDSGSRVAAAIGYKSGGEWVTEGWWNMEPSACIPIVPEPLQERFYYIYARDWDNGGDWGGATPMCTQKKVFTIQGVDDCRSKGFDRSGFSEIDTQGEKSWTVRLSGATGP